MDGKTRIEKLTPNEWRGVAEDLLEIAPTVCEALKAFEKQHPEAKIKGSAFDAEKFAANVRAAVSAVSYVSMYAYDKCNFVIIPDEQTEKHS